jgi:CheY-like chemotaxis protein
MKSQFFKEPVKILIIEDNPMFRSLAIEVFDGCQRISAINAADGFAKFKEHCPDITLLDIGLPDKSGLDLLPELIKYDPEAFIVMLTNSNISLDVESAKKNGAAAYITKPFSYKKVNDCLYQYAEHKKRLKELSPNQRAKFFIDELKNVTETVDLKQQQTDKKKQQEKILKETIDNWRILFVDDSEKNRVRAGTQLQKLGCIVDTAQSGYDALSQAEKTQYDMIFMASQMPRMDGYTATQLIRQEEKYLKKEQCVIIGLIEYHQDIEQKLWQKAGMDSFILKPAKFSQLSGMVDKYIAERIALVR